SMVTPMYREMADGITVAITISATCAPQAARACEAASVGARLLRRIRALHAVTHSTCCSIDTGMFDSTDGLCGPVIVNRFGKPALIRPRYERGPSAHFSATRSH